MPLDSTIPVNTVSLLKRQQYATFGKHSAVKTCHYTKQAIRGKAVCYKQKFYGIQSHQCIQMSPAVSHCDQKCTYCWRPTHTFRPTFDVSEIDDPGFVADESINAQNKQLVGFKGEDSIMRRKFEESKTPRHVAISLTGEPTLYPKLPELIDDYHARGISTFVVSNALHPEMIERLAHHAPTQLYLSIDCATKEEHIKLNHPDFPEKSWDALNRSIELLSVVPTRRVIRLTCVKGVNMHDPKAYARLITKGKPDFVEIKGYMHVGFSIYRLSKEAMPSFAEVEQFARDVADAMGYDVRAKDPSSYVVLLTHPDWKDKSTLIDFRALFPNHYDEQDKRLAAWQEKENAAKKANKPLPALVAASRIPTIEKELAPKSAAPKPLPAGNYSFDKNEIVSEPEDV